MVLLDDREDTLLSRYLVEQGLDVSITRLESGDLCFEGSGPRNSPVLVGIERKHLSDLAASMLDRRLSGHQLVKMRAAYDFIYLLIEDFWRPDPESNGIQILRGKGWTTFPPYRSPDHFTFRQLDGYLSSLEMFWGVVILRSSTMRETAAIYASKYHWWQKPWHEHRSHSTLYAPGPNEYAPRGKASFDMRQPGFVERVAYQLPGIDSKAWDVGMHFSSVMDLCLASEKDWQSIPGIGPITAHNAYEAIRTRKRNL